MIGLERGKTVLCEHEAEWGTEAQRTMDLLKSILGTVVKDIAHVGSTSIKSIKAKPIIDIAVAVDDFTEIISRDNELESRGFYYRHAVDDAEKILHGNVDFKAIDVRQVLYACGGWYDGSNKLQTHFIHIVKAGSTEWRNYIYFRDYLNSNLSIAKEYENLKEQLCAKYADNRPEYTLQKQNFIKRVFLEADKYYGHKKI